jgi:RNA polymerase-interacting CarD/CdnL/TRCF family regulator
MATKPNRFGEFVSFMKLHQGVLSDAFCSQVIAKVQVAMQDTYDRGIIEGKRLVQSRQDSFAQNLTAKADDVLGRLIRYRSLPTRKPSRAEKAIYEQDRGYLARELSRAREITLDEVAQAAAGEDI